MQVQSARPKFNSLRGRQRPACFGYRSKRSASLRRLTKFLYVAGTLKGAKAPKCPTRKGSTDDLRGADSPAGRHARLG